MRDVVAGRRALAGDLADSGHWAPRWCVGDPRSPGTIGPARRAGIAAGRSEPGIMPPLATGVEAAIQARTWASSTGSGPEPWDRTTAWQAGRSKRGPKAQPA